MKQNCTSHWLGERPCVFVGEKRSSRAQRMAVTWDVREFSLGGESAFTDNHSWENEVFCMPPVPLPTHHEDRTYTYTQLVREGDIAIFRQVHKENPKVVRYEVAKIRVAPEKAWPDGRITPEREAGVSISEISRTIGMRRHHVMKWLSRFQHEGVPGLHGRPRAGGRRRRAHG
jgi:hypothetical protein